MGYAGLVKNGVVVFSSEAGVAEGTEVEIVPFAVPEAGSLPKAFLCHDAHAFLREVEKLGRRGWVFRGHATAGWHLKSSLQRFVEEHAIDKSSWKVRESETIRRFQAVAHLYLSHVPDRKDQISWLSLVQHYGGPTRLLDFTFNPAAALYFAVREAKPGKSPFCVHALHLASVRSGSREKRASLPMYSGKKPKANPKEKEYSIGRKEEAGVDFVGLFDARLASERLAAQEGLFLVPSRIDLDLEKWLRDLTVNHVPGPHSTHWLKYEFRNDSVDQYKTIVKQLVQMGMSAARLFPGLSGLCESLRFAWHEVAKDLMPDEDE